MRTSFLPVLGLGICLFTPLPTHADTPSPIIIEKSALPIAAPYPAPTIAHRQVEQAFKEAKQTGRKVLLDFGANWCPDCKILAGILALPDAKKWLDSQFVIVPINVEKINANLDIAQSYGVNIKAIPTIIIITPEGHPLNGDSSLALGNARNMSPQAVFNLLSQWNNRKE